MMRCHRKISPFSVLILLAFGTVISHRRGRARTPSDRDSSIAVLTPQPILGHNHPQ
jgi:hypothetical protein